MTLVWIHRTQCNLICFSVLERTQILTWCSVINTTRGPVYEFVHEWGHLGWPGRIGPQLVPPQSHSPTAPHHGLVPPPHLLHHSACVVIDPARAPCQASSVAGSWAVAPTPATAVTVCRVIGGAVGPPLAPALAWCLLLICFSILPQSHCHRGPLELAVPPLPPFGSASSLMPTMVHATPW